jgi:hypothetical protein
MDTADLESLFEIAKKRSLNAYTQLGNGQLVPTNLVDTIRDETGWETLEPHLKKRFRTINDINIEELSKFVNENGFIGFKYLNNGSQACVLLARHTNGKTYAVRVSDFTNGFDSDEGDRAPLPFSLNIYSQFKNDYRLEIMPLVHHIINPIWDAIIDDDIKYAFEDLFNTLVEGTCFEITDNTLGHKDIGLLPDGTIINLDGGSCYIKPDTSDAQIEIDRKIVIARITALSLPEPLQWRTSDGRLKQDIWFPNPFDNKPDLKLSGMRPS